MQLRFRLLLNRNELCYELNRSLDRAPRQAVNAASWEAIALLRTHEDRPFPWVAAHNPKRGQRLYPISTFPLDQVGVKVAGQSKFETCPLATPLRAWLGIRVQIL